MQPITITIVGALILAAVGGGALWGRFTAPAKVPPPASVTVVRPTPNVVVAIRELAQLNTAEFHMERVVDLSEKQRVLFGMVEAQDAILLVASGRVTAGCDLDELEDGDVTVDPARKTAELVLPPPRVLSAAIDNRRTYVHRRDTDLFARRQEKLETQARQEAERTIVDAAKEAGILDRARKSARRVVTSLVESLGYEKVTVRFKDD